MKKMSKVVLAFASIFALVGCGGENNGGDTTKTIENAAAVKRLQTVTEEMGKAAGFKVEGKESLSVSLKQADYKDTDNKDVKGGSLELTSTGNFNLELLLEEAMPKAGKATASITTDASGSEISGHADVSAEAYLKEGYVYAKSTVTTPAEKEGDDPVVEENKTGMNIAPMLEDIKGTLNNLEGKRPSEIINMIPDISIDEENAAMFDHAVNVITKNLPNCNLSTNKKTDTLSWKLTNADIENIIDKYFASTLPAPGETDLSEEDYNALVAATTAKATTIKTLVSSIVKINNAQFSISIYDGKYISAVALDLDVELNFAASLEIFPSDTSIKLKASASSEISLLDANYTITYPEDMESWLPAPDIDTDTGDNTTSK